MITDLSSVANASKSFLLVSEPSRDEATLGILSALRDDVDHSIHCVGAPQCRARAADDLDAFNIFQHDILDIPENAGKQRRVNTPAVDEHQHLVREAAIKPTRADCPFIAVDAANMKAGNSSQEFRDTRQTGSADIFLSDDMVGRRGLRQLLFLLGNRRHFHVHEVFEADLTQGLGKPAWGRPSKA